MLWLDALADAGGEEHVWLHDGDTLGVFSAELGVDEQVDQVVLGGFLESLDGETLETDVVLVGALDQLSDQLGEWELADQKLGGLLVLLDFASRDGTLLRAADLLDALGGTRGLTDGLTRDGLAWGLGSGGRLACGVLSACHVEGCGKIQHTSTARVLGGGGVGNKKLRENE